MSLFDQSETFDLSVIGQPEYVVYRLSDESWQPIYIGYSRDLPQRLRAHRTARWWPAVRRCEYVRFPDERSARRAELAAIYAEQPLRNEQRPRRDPLEDLELDLVDLSP